MLQNVVRRKPAKAETAPQPSDPPQKRLKANHGGDEGGIAGAKGAEPQQQVFAPGGAGVGEAAQRDSVAVVGAGADCGDDGGGLTALLGEYGSDSDAS